MIAFSISTLNFDSIRDDGKRAPVFEYLRSLKYDFYLLQETHVQAQDFEGWSPEWSALASGILEAIGPGV